MYRQMFLVACWTTLICMTVQAEEFKITSEVYSGDSKIAVSQNLTLFSERLILDFLLSNDAHPKPMEVVLYDSQQKKLVLLDAERKVKTEISDLQIEKLLDSLTRETQANEQSRFLISDTFSENTDFSSNEVTLTSPNIVYQFRGRQPQNVAILPQYLEFLDAFTKLNASDPRKFPPFPRMKLNQKIRQLGWIPSEVRVSIKANGFFKENMEARSNHTLTMGLSSKDRKMIADAKSDWLKFRKIELIEYRGIKKEVAEKPGNETTAINR